MGGVFHGVPRRLLALFAALAVLQLAAAVATVQLLHRGGGAIGLAAAMLAAFALEVALRRTGEQVGLVHVAAVREDLYRHLLSADVDLVRRRRHGAMLQSFVGDMTALRQWVSEGMMRAGLAVISGLALIGWLAVQAPGAALAAGGVMAVCAAVIFMLRPVLRRRVALVRKRRGAVAALASDRLAATATVQSAGRIESEVALLRRRVAKLTAASLPRATITGVLRALPHLATTAMLASAVLGEGGAGALVVAGLLGLALRDLARAVELEVPGRISRARIARLMAVPMRPSPPLAERVPGERGVLVLDRVTLGPARLGGRFAPGAVVLVEGEPGDRRALFRALAGLAAPDRGTIRLDGLDTRALPPSRRRSRIGWASGELPLLSGNIAQNLRYRLSRTERGRVAALGAEWDLDLQARHGDAARIGLVRALAGDPALLLLDLIEAALAEADIARLAERIARWPGAVVLASGHPLLRACATDTLQMGARRKATVVRLPVAGARP